MDFSNIKTILFDGDGVLWRAEEKISGFDHIFQILDQNHIQWALLTNNNTKTVQNYIDKLAKFGIETDESKIFSSSTITVAYVKKHYGAGASIFVVGMPALIETLQTAGFNVYHGETAPPEKVNAVVSGMDRAITHNKIKVAMRLILAGAEFIATNTDSSFPTPEGINPGTGMVIGALIGTTNIQPTVIGKPASEIYLTAIEQLGASPDSTIMIGDRLNTDIQGANIAGIKSVVVFSGVTSQEVYKESTIKADAAYPSIAELAQALEKSFHV
ncbi:MAG: HAD-IIA family hydrolase [Anaerolineaceae bacterium]|nr:HAD-IIA family hydrolase [Anaerolineaceae bacterium]